MNWIVIVKNSKNQRIVECFAVKSEGLAFYFQNHEGKWINPQFTDGAMKSAFKSMFADDSDFMWRPQKVMTQKAGKYTLEIREL